MRVVLGILYKLSWTQSITMPCTCMSNLSSKYEMHWGVVDAKVAGSIQSDNQFKLKQ